MTYETAGHTDESETYHMCTEMGLDNQPLSSEAQRHYINHRLRCRQCKQHVVIFGPFRVLLMFCGSSLLYFVLPFLFTLRSPFSPFLNGFCHSGRTIFCLVCRRIPYHTGFSCEEYEKYLKSPKCRFCTVGVHDRNSYENPKNSLCFKEVCNSSECVKNVGATCNKLLECGHPCCGSYGENECPPCLYPGKVSQYIRCEPLPPLLSSFLRFP